MRILRLAFLTAAAGILMAPGPIGSTAVGDSTSTLPIGDVPVGNRFGGATPVFDTGNPETETWGPTAFLDAGDFAGGSVHYAFVGQDAVSGSHTWPEHYGNLTLTGGNTGALVYDAKTPFNDGTRGVENTGNELTAGYFANLSATDVDTSQNYIMIWVGKPSYSGIGADHLTVLDGGTGPDLRIRSANSTNVCQPTYNSSAGQEVLQGACVDDTWCVCIAITSATAIRGGWNYGQGIEVDDEAQRPKAGAGATILGINSNQAGDGGDTGPNVTAAVIYIDGHTLADETASHAWAAKAAARIMGSYLPTGGTPSTWTRASTAYLRKCDPTANATTFFNVGDNWPRREVSCGYTWDDPTSSETTTAGFMQEPPGTNILGFGTVLDDAAWTKINSATVDADQQNDPAGDATLDDIDGVTGSGEHGVSAAETLTAATYVFSAVFKPGNQAFAYLDVSSIANVSAYFDSADCQPDTVGASATAYGQDLGDLCFVAIRYTGTAASHTHRLLCAEADGDKDYAGAAGDCAYGWAGVVQELVPSSPILTVDATDVTRSVDVLRYQLPAAYATPVTLVADKTSTVVDLSSYALDLSAGTAATSDRIYLYTTASNAQRIGWYDSGAGNENYGQLVNGTREIIRGYHDGENIRGWTDGVEEIAEVATAARPEGMEYVSLGNGSATSTEQAPRSIWRTTIYSQALAPGEQGTGDDVPVAPAILPAFSSGFSSGFMGAN